MDSPGVQLDSVHRGSSGNEEAALVRPTEGAIGAYLWHHDLAKKLGLLTENLDGVLTTSEYVTMVIKSEAIRTTRIDLGEDSPVCEVFTGLNIVSKNVVPTFLVVRNSCVANVKYALVKIKGEPIGFDSVSRNSLKMTIFRV